MKFRGMMTDSIAMKDFMNIVNTMSKLSKVAVLRITSDKLYIIILDDEKGPRKPFVWCSLMNSYYFTQYNMLGVSEDHNEIYLEFSPVLMAKSLISLKNQVPSLKIKLTNKQSPCLTLEIDTISSEGVSRQLVHDVPVEVIGRKHWADYAEPNLQDFHVTLQMPALKYVRNIIDHMKNMNNLIIVSANKDGRLTFKIDNALIKLSAHFSNLNIQSVAEGLMNHVADSDEEESTVEDSMRETVSCQVDVRKFVTLLNGLQITNHRTICSIVNERMVKLHFEQPNVVTLHCFLSHISS